MVCVEKYKVVTKQKFELLILNKQITVAINNSNYKNLLHHGYDVLDEFGRVCVNKKIVIHPYDLTVNSRIKVDCVCNSCKKIKTLTIQRLWESINKNKSYFCATCFKKRQSEEKRQNNIESTIDFIHTNSDYIYINHFYKFYGGRNRLFLTLFCEKHGRFEQNSSSIKNNIICAKCGNENKGESLRISNEAKIEILQNIYNIEQSIKYSTIFKGSTDYQTIKCPYCESDWRVRLIDIKLGRKSCSHCFGDRYSGTNSSKWNGGIRNIAQYARGFSKEWVNVSRTHFKNTCLITQKKFNNNLDIHHVDTGFANILEDAFEEIQMPIYPKVQDYTDNELLEIKKIIREKHSKIPLGVCLSEDIHYEFHSIKGFTNTTREDFIQYVQEFYPHRLNDVIKTLDEIANLSVNAIANWERM